MPEAISYETFTSGTVAAGLTASVYAPAAKASIMATSAVLSPIVGVLAFRFDGGTPTADNAHYLRVGDYPFFLTSPNEIRRFLGIQIGDVVSETAITYRA